ncbi:MAG: hypothetical protein ACK52V_03140 [Betaproteobacteria bacterium]|jgi:hypothetical protein
MNTQGWTTQPPTADGFYWLVIEATGGCPCVVEIAGRFVHFASSVEPCELSEFASLARWYGPITAPPTEPQPPAQVTDAMVLAANAAMFGKPVLGDARFETLRLGLEAAMAARTEAQG